MTQVTDYLTPYDIGKLGNLLVLAQQVVEGFCSGLHRSPHRGFGVEYKERGAYRRCDATRLIAWKVYGKTDRLYIR